MNFSKYILLYTLIPLFILFVGSAYVRFMIIHDYLVTYEIACDPASASCFIGCEDEDCTSEYYYAKITNYAPTLFDECGSDVSQCDFAQTCNLDDRHCSITYCVEYQSEIPCDDITDFETESPLNDIII